MPTEISILVRSSGWAICAKKPIASFPLSLWSTQHGGLVWHITWYYTHLSLSLYIYYEHMILLASEAISNLKLRCVRLQTSVVCTDAIKNVQPWKFLAESKGRVFLVERKWDAWNSCLWGNYVRLQLMHKQRRILIREKKCFIFKSMKRVQDKRVSKCLQVKQLIRT